jgi:hypothetical protein
MLLAVALALSLAQSPASGDTPLAPVTSVVPHPRLASRIKRQWGIDVIGVRQTAVGYMLEFRYRVLDAEKAAPVFKRQTKPILIDETSGARLEVPTPPTTGALRNSYQPLAGHTYWMVFANPGRFIRKGQRVTVEIGDFVAEHLVVE